MIPLNDEQLAAVQATEGAVRVIAGAGSGKTRTLVSRYCYLVSELGIAPKNILCATFTNRAANEMKRRVREAVGDLDLSYICTFHAFCVQFLKEEIHRLSFPREFLILDAEDTKGLLQNVFTDMGLSLRDKTIQKAYDEVYEARKMKADTYISDICLLDNEQLRARYEAATEQNDEIWYRYLYEQKKCFGCDFNDLINFTVYILEHFPDARDAWQDRMQYVMVDEFQDVSAKQYSIARHLSGKHGNLFIVGDPDQTIYSWRGSHMKLLLEFDLQYPKSKTFTITRNYRSTPQILKVSDAVIAHNVVRYPKTLQAVKPDGKKPLYCHALSEKQEARWIHDTIRKLHEDGLPYGAVAVLYRAHHLTRPLEECFIRNGLPYKIYSGVEFYGRREVKDAVCYLRMLTAADDLSFLRTINTPSRKIGKKKLDALKAYARREKLSLYQALERTADTPEFRGTQAKAYLEAIESCRRKCGTHSLQNLVQSLLDQSGYEAYMRQQGDQDRLDNLAEFKRGAVQADADETTLEEFLDRIALFTNLDRKSADDTVKLMTIHAAKGTEYPAVFVCGLAEGVFPGKKVDTPEEMEEERRLAYVAMTRAEDRLFLSDSEGVANDNTFKYPSRFLFEAGWGNMDVVKPLDNSLVERARRFIAASEKALTAQANLFAEGDRVVHPVFGAGTVVAVDPAQTTYLIQFDGLATTRSLLFTANLKRER